MQMDFGAVTKHFAEAFCRHSRIRGFVQLSRKMSLVMQICAIGTKLAIVITIFLCLASDDTNDNESSGIRRFELYPSDGIRTQTTPERNYPRDPNPRSTDLGAMPILGPNGQRLARLFDRGRTRIEQRSSWLAGACASDRNP